MSSAAVADPAPGCGRRVRVAAALLCCLGLAACAGVGPLSSSLPPEAPLRVELDDTPFFSQDDFQCGPASLATVLAARGIAVSPEELTREIYLPARRGSLQVELLGAARRRGMLAYVLPGEASALFEQVSAGNPVLVLQNLGVASYPLWHYAVVIGFDRSRDEVILRSGQSRREVLSWRGFERSWRLGGQWAVVVVPPGTIPVGAVALDYVGACAGLESAGQLAPARTCYEAAADRWPREALARLGLGNVAYAQGEFVRAATAYAAAVTLAPGSGIARNNLAQALLGSGCRDAALAEARRALSLVAGTPLEPEVRDTLRDIDAAEATPGHGACEVQPPR